MGDNGWQRATEERRREIERERERPDIFLMV